MHTTFSQSHKSDSTQMKKILKDISIKSIELGDINSELSTHQLNSLWIGYEPSLENEIDSVEQRLGIKLPQEYKDFLMITNGFHAANSVEPSFCQLDQIDFLMKVDPELQEIWNEGNPEVGQKLKTAIKIGGFGEDQYFFLIPPSNENSNWEYWIFAAWAPGETVYNTLIDYFIQVLKTTIVFNDNKRNTHNSK